MSATLISNNTTIKINGKISASTAGTGGGGIIYTVPANSYLEFHAGFSAGGGSGDGFLVIDGVSVATCANGASFNIGQSSSIFKAGPGAVISTYSPSGSTTVQGVITGILFTNTP